MRVECPKCHQPIAGEDLNAAAAIAVCKPCGEAFPLAGLIGVEPSGSNLIGGGAELEAIARADVAAPPAGCWCDDGVDGFRAGASARSCAAFFLIPFTLVWGGGSMAGIYGSQIASGEFDIAQSLFGIPFLLGTIALTSATLFCLFGRCEIAVAGDEGTLFTGFLGVGRRRRFDWRSLREVRVGVAGWTKNRQPQHAIELVGDTGEPVRFASIVSTPRRAWLVALLRNRLAQRR